MEIKEVTKTITKTVYISKDGTEHDSEWCCENYEVEQMQEKLEKQCDERLRVYTTNSNYPSMLNLNWKPKYMLFLIKNEEDLDLFIKTYTYWFNDLEKRWEVAKEFFEYPNVLCIVDFRGGNDEHRLYSLNQQVRQYNAFIDELSYEVDAKLNPKE